MVARPLLMLLLCCLADCKNVDTRRAHHSHRDLEEGSNVLDASPDHGFEEEQLKCDVADLKDLLDDFYISTTDARQMKNIFGVCLADGEGRVSDLVLEIEKDPNAYCYWLGAKRKFKCDGGIGCRPPSSKLAYFEYFNRRAWCHWFHAVRGSDQFKLILETMDMLDFTEREAIIEIIGPDLWHAKLVIEKLQAYLEKETAYADYLAKAFKWSAKIPGFKKLFFPANFFGLYSKAIEVAASAARGWVLGGLYGTTNRVFDAEHFLREAGLCGSIQAQTHVLGGCTDVVLHIRNIMQCSNY